MRRAGGSKRGRGGLDEGAGRLAGVRGRSRWSRSVVGRESGEIAGRVAGTTERGGGETEAAGWGGERVYGLHKRVHIFAAFTRFSLIEHTNTRLEPACPVSSVRLASRISIRIH